MPSMLSLPLESHPLFSASEHNAHVPPHGAHSTCAFEQARQPSLQQEHTTSKCE
jgi:hypothetical protein